MSAAHPGPAGSAGSEIGVLQAHGTHATPDPERQLFPRRSPRLGAWLETETVGSLIDRLSINALKLHRLAIQAERPGATPAQRDTYRRRLAVLRAQRQELLSCLQRLLDGLRDSRGELHFGRRLQAGADPH